jgi:hypothetical protein
MPDGTPNPGHIARDTRADAVLAGRQFVYYGASGPRIPDRFRNGEKDLVHQFQSHRCRFPEAMVEEVIAWLEGLETGVYGPPAEWAD